MDEVSLSIWIIASIFFFIALAYSSVGLGGGSSYTALLIVIGFSSLTIPALSLSLNLLVSSIGSYNFIRHKHLRLRLILPFILTSMPMAWLGGMMPVSQEVFQWILFISLAIILVRIYMFQEVSFRINLSKMQQIIVSLTIGGVLGLIAGIVGIGGGVYLVPLIIIFSLGTIKEAAACGAVFVWLNSLVGLTSRLQHNFINLLDYYPLIVGAIAGGIIGSQMGASKIKPKTMEKILGLIIVVAVFFLARKLLF